MTETERICRIWHELWDMRDPDRGAAIIADDCRFEDVALGEAQTGPEAYKRDYERWRTAFPDGTLEIVIVIVDGEWALWSSSTGATKPVRWNRVWDVPAFGSVHGGSIRQRHAC